MPLTLRYVARSEVGLVREGNEDSGYAGPRLLAVADGMGGHAAGEVASSIAVQALSEIDGTQVSTDPDGERRTKLSAAIREASARMRARISADERLDGMGTTATAALWDGANLVIAHVGDSRAYLLHADELHRVTHDHTYVQSLIDEGKLTEDEAYTHPARSLIMRTLDGRADPDIDLFTIEVAAGDRLLICSDGLTGVVRDETLSDVLRERADLAATVEQLVELAYAGGAPDNVTVVLAEIVEVEEAPSKDDTAEAYIVGAAAEQPVDVGSAQAVGPGDDGAEAGDDETVRYARQTPKRSRWVYRGFAAALAVALVGSAGTFAYAWSQDQYYVGADDDGAVTIYQGVSQALGPLNLSSVHTVVSGLPVDALAPLVREQVDETITADGLPQAEQIVTRLRTTACRAHGVTATPTPTATPTQTNLPGATLSPGAGATPSTTVPPAGAASPGSLAVPQPSPAPAVPAPSTSAGVVPDPNASPQVQPPGTPTPDATTPGATPTPTPTPTATLPPGLECHEAEE